MAAHRTERSMDQLSLLISLPIVVALVTFWLWMFREFLGDDRFTDNERVIWLAAFLFLNIFAAAAYYVRAYRDRR
jgi:hypothetical protein